VKEIFKNKALSKYVLRYAFWGAEVYSILINRKLVYWVRDIMLEIYQREKEKILFYI
jgi:hypothetical protein